MHDTRLNWLVGHREIQDGTLGGRAVKGLGWDGHLAHGIAFYAGLAHGRMRDVANRDRQENYAASAGCAWDTISVVV